MTQFDEFDHDWHHDGRVTTFSWLGDVEAATDRVYALAFVPEGSMLLVSERSNDSVFWLPGGGIEEGETEIPALQRELLEEAGATLHSYARLGIQRSEDDVWGVQHEAFFWARITLDPSFEPQHEIGGYTLVPPGDFLDTLFWGRSDPKAEMLLRSAVERERLSERTSRP